MKKIGFKVYLNDELISINGIDADGVVTQIITLRNDSVNNEQPITLHSGGYVKETDEHYKWIDRDLQENDRITIEVIKDIAFDEPVETKLYDNPALNAFVLKSKLKSYYQLKEELKDHIKDLHKTLIFCSHYPSSVKLSLFCFKLVATMYQVFNLSEYQDTYIYDLAGDPHPTENLKQVKVDGLYYDD